MIDMIVPNGLAQKCDWQMMGCDLERAPADKWDWQKMDYDLEPATANIPEQVGSPTAQDAQQASCSQQHSYRSISLHFL